MSLLQRYQIANGVRFFSDAFGIDAQRGLRRAGMPADFLGAGERAVSAEEFYAIFEAMEAEMAAPDLPLQIAKLIMEHGVDSSVYSFYCSPNVRIGLQRKAVLKPLLMPLSMRFSEYDEHLVVTFASPTADLQLPGLIGWFNLVYFVLAIRHATGVDVCPAAIEVASARPGWDDAAEVFGCPITHRRSYRLVLRSQDADLPMITRNDEKWSDLELGVSNLFLRDMPPKSSAARVRQALVEGLPGGQVTADQIARSLALSKRSLQRRLGEEGVSFKEVLEDTRRAMALNYLQKSDMSVQEIALLLGFRDPSSFFRAFRSWTGTTPQSVRRSTAA